MITNYYYNVQRTWMTSSADDSVYTVQPSHHNLYKLHLALSCTPRTYICYFSCLMLHVLLPSSVPNPLEAQGRFICNAHLFVVFHGCGPNLPGDMGVMEYLPREQWVWDSPPRKLKKVFYASATYNIVSVEVLLNNVYCHPHHKLFTVPVPLPICTPAGSGLCLKIYPPCMPVQCHAQFY